MQVTTSQNSEPNAGPRWVAIELPAHTSAQSASLSALGIHPALAPRVLHVETWPLAEKNERRALGFPHFSAHVAIEVPGVNNALPCSAGAGEPDACPINDGQENFYYE